MRSFVFTIKDKNGNAVNTKLLNNNDKIKVEMKIIELWDQIVEKDDCREAKDLIKKIQYS